LLREFTEKQYNNQYGSSNQSWFNAYTTVFFGLVFVPASVAVVLLAIRCHQQQNEDAKGDNGVSSSLNCWKSSSTVLGAAPFSATLSSISPIIKQADIGSTYAPIHAQDVDDKSTLQREGQSGLIYDKSSFSFLYPETVASSTGQNPMLSWFSILSTSSSLTKSGRLIFLDLVP
jgi:hypothetical protein